MRIVKSSLLCSYQRIEVVRFSRIQMRKRKFVIDISTFNIHRYKRGHDLFKESISKQVLIHGV